MESWKELEILINDYQVALIDQDTAFSKKF